MPGPAPKPAALRQRKNRSSTAATLVAPPVTRADLPAKEPDWHHLTRTWWATIWASPMVQEWVDADVPGLFALARLVDEFWTAPSSDAAKFAAEIRMQQREYGLSPLSRRQLEWEVQRLELSKPKPAAPAPSVRRPRRGLLGVLQGGAAAI